MTARVNGFLIKKQKDLVHSIVKEGFAEELELYNRTGGLMFSVYDGMKPRGRMKNCSSFTEEALKYAGKVLLKKTKEG